MKRLLLAALPLLLLTAHVAEARQVTKRLAVIYTPSDKAAGATQGKSDVIQKQFVHENVIATLDEWGVDYVTISASSIPTGKMEWYRTGVFALGPDTITASAVLHEAFNRRAASYDFPQYRPDSLTRMVQVDGKYFMPAVPQFMLICGPELNSDLSNFIGSTTACSLGTISGAGSGAAVGGGSGIGHEAESSYYTPGSSGRYFGTSTSNAARLNLSTVGGVLPLLAPYTNNVSSTLQDSLKMPVDVLAKSLNDSYRPGISARPDTAFVWKKLNSSSSNGSLYTVNASGTTVTAQPLIFAMPHSVIGDNETVQTSRSEWDGSIFMAGLAALDSTLSGTLLGEKKVRGLDALPKKQAVTVDGAFARCSQQFGYGSHLSDSTAIKATVDSLAAYGIPFLVGVNVDSVAAYPYERAWWSKGGARFTPQVWSGVHGANGAASYVAGRYTLRDLFGHARARTAYGPAWPDTSATPAADTSQFAMFKYAFARNDSLFPGRSSRFLLPPLDDMIAGTLSPDSTIIAARLAGASGVRICGLDTVRTGYQQFVQGGWWKGMRLLAHSGEYVTGASRLVSVPNSTPAAALDSGYAYHPFGQIFFHHELAMVRGGANVASVIGQSMTSSGSSNGFETLAGSSKALGFDTSNSTLIYDANKYHNAWGVSGRAPIIKAHASGFGGSARIAALVQPTNVSSTNPLRPDWWIIKSADGMARVMNAISGRTLIMWDYPENIVP